MEQTLIPLAKRHRGAAFVSASIDARASASSDLLHVHLGVSDFKLPALVVTWPGTMASSVHSQMRAPTAASAAAFLQTYLHGAPHARCALGDSTLPVLGATLREYQEYRAEMAERIYTSGSAAQCAASRPFCRRMSRCNCCVTCVIPMGP